MSGKLPVVSGANIVAAFRRAGYEFNHQRGSYIILRRVEAPHSHLSIPNHKEFAKGTLRGLIRDAGLTVEQFVELLK